MYTVAAGVPLIYDIGLTLFLQHIIRSATHPIHTHLIATLLSQVQLERDGETITRSTVRECVDILLRLTGSEREAGKNVYLTDFEPEFLRRSSEFYSMEAVDMLETGDASRYLRNVSLSAPASMLIRQVERRLAEEADRTAHYLSTFTHPPLQDLLVEQLLTPHLKSILSMPGSGLVSLIDSDRVQDLRRMYILFLRVPVHVGKDALRLALRLDIEERGKTINEGAALEPEAGPSGAPAQDGEPNMDLDGDISTKGKGKARPVPAGSVAIALSSALRWVQDVLELKDKFDRILDQAFGGDKAVQTSINEVRSFTPVNAYGRHSNHSLTVTLEHQNSYPSISMSTSRRGPKR